MCYTNSLISLSADEEEDGEDDDVTLRETVDSLKFADTLFIVPKISV